ncbi:nucleotide-binding alpha-beta plait domain, Zinc finger, RING/FYVE/PHD-type [Artemisia annua]|uniref:Nucleotide-binding alpha-beta plait domain, Zinc finger, RING/FYVE/PHD-type n=1 Tax=Artemisia annua TaxID=35608 RepID=A0A2U1PAA6_ARTAN|nr:nucleotide-binding alpha-beta plait domain, Zinc finger, RING/FYVE/PHD-type [Artemisia annua]
MSNEGEKRCPLCAEEMDWTDLQLKPCKCGYQVCVWCWHHIMDMAEKDATEGRCPACRAPYDKDRIVGLESNFQRVAANSSSRKQKQPKPKQKTNEGRKDLSSVRVIQRKMAYIIGLPLSLADEDLLQRKDYFGQYGKVTKISLSRTAGGTLQSFVNDTCSVYITYSKEEEAVRCIQSVHGYVLDGRYLRASFGTAKYCHAWLRNTPCNNVACLYLHSIGAEEDSFGKDEIAAVHTRNRVQEIVGAAQYLHKRSGSMLPSPVDDHLNSRSASSFEEPVFSSGLKDVAYAAVASGDQKDRIVKSSKHTSFVDIVGRSCNSGSGSDKDVDVNSVTEGQMLNLCSDMSSVCVNTSIHANDEDSDLVSIKSSTPEQSISGVVSSKLYSEPFREASIPSSVEQANLLLKDTNITKEQSGLGLDLHTSSQKASVYPSVPAVDIKNDSDHPWRHTESHSRNGYSADHNGVYNYADEASKKSACTNFALNDGFQSSANSDRIYRSSKSFSNEEIVEHLRRLDGGSPVNDDEQSAAVESSIISNILSMDFDGCDDDSILPQTVAGLYEGKNGWDGPSWNLQNTDRSRFSFANEQSHANQELDKFSMFQDFRENQDCIYKPQYQASRAQNVTPPGFSKPPPGFLSGTRTEQVVSASSGYMNNSLSNSHYRMPSIVNLSNSSDDLIDPAIMAVGRGKSPSFDMRSSSSDDETKRWLLMQQQQSASTTQYHPQPQFSQTSYIQQHNTPHFPSSYDNYYGDFAPRFVDQRHQSYTQQQYLQPKFANGHISNGYQQAHLDHGTQQVNNRNEVGLTEQTQRNEMLGFEKLVPSYSDYKFQMPSSGDVYTQVFGM